MDQGFGTGDRKRKQGGRSPHPAHPPSRTPARSLGQPRLAHDLVFNAPWFHHVDAAGDADMRQSWTNCDCPSWAQTIPTPPGHPDMKSPIRASLTVAHLTVTFIILSSSIQPYHTCTTTSSVPPRLAASAVPHGTDAPPHRGAARTIPPSLAHPDVRSQHAGFHGSGPL